MSSSRSEYWASRDRDGHILSSGQFNFLRRMVELVLPALATFYFTIAQIFSLPGGEEVVASAAALATLLGVIIVWLRRGYEESDAKYDGEFVINEHDPMKDTYSLEVETPMFEVPKQSELRLKVRHEQPPA